MCYCGGFYNNGVHAIDVRDAFTVAPAPGKLMTVPAMNILIDQTGMKKFTSACEKVVYYGLL